MKETLDEMERAEDNRAKAESIITRSRDHLPRASRMVEETSEA